MDVPSTLVIEAGIEAAIQEQKFELSGECRKANKTQSGELEAGFRDWEGVWEWRWLGG